MYQISHLATAWGLGQQNPNFLVKITIFNNLFVCQPSSRKSLRILCQVELQNHCGKIEVFPYWVAQKVAGYITWNKQHYVDQNNWKTEDRYYFGRLLIWLLRRICSTTPSWVSNSILSWISTPRAEAGWKGWMQYSKSATVVTPCYFSQLCKFEISIILIVCHSTNCLFGRFQFTQAFQRLV